MPYADEPILLLSTSDTDLLSARAAGGPVPYRFANPARLAVEELPALLEGAGLVVVRLLGGVRAWQDGSTCCGPTAGPSSSSPVNRRRTRS